MPQSELHLLYQSGLLLAIPPPIKRRKKIPLIISLIGLIFRIPDIYAIG